VGSAYYTVEQDGFRLVATISSGIDATPVRLVATLGSGQNVAVLLPTGGLEPSVRCYPGLSALRRLRAARPRQSNGNGRRDRETDQQSG
jgi:hypothetical protein